MMRQYGFLLTALALVGCDDKGDTGSGSASSDADGDGFTVDVDCNDDDAAVFPGAAELCDDADNNCNDEVDEDPTDGTAYFADNDGDGYGTADMSAMFCGSPADGYVDNSDDCDDAYARAYPDGEELCDGVDNDCDGEIDDGTSDIQTFYADTDTDGYGDPGNSLDACAAPAGYVANDDDCEDTDASVNPTSVWYQDADGDGYGNDVADTFTGCEAPFLYTAVGGDCNDTSFDINPDATEVCNALDDDCDGNIPTEEIDGDKDGSPVCGTDCDDSNASIYEGAAEVCSDSVDNNCDGVADESCPTSLSTVADFTLSGPTSSDYMGRSISAGDVNGDGVDDLVTGAYYADATSSTGSTLTYAGQTYVVFGPLTSGTSLNASSADVKLSGSSASLYTGWNVRANADVDGDGYNEIITTSYIAESYKGAAYVFYGPTTSSTYTANADATITGKNASDYLGYQKFKVGDADGDGDDDVVTSAFYYDIGTLYSVGVISIFDNPSGSYTATEADTTIYGSTQYGYLGYSMEFGGDADGDGVNDFAYGEYYFDIAYLIYGPLSSGNYDYRDADVALIGNNSYGATDLASGDLNGDGYDDYIYGSYYDSTGASYGGGAYIVYGPVKGDVDVAGDASAHVYGSSASDYYGYSYYGRLLAEDLDGDGTDDLVMSSYQIETPGSGLYSMGGTMVFYGPVSGNMSTAAFDRGLYGSASYEYAGIDTETGDLDGDGALDLLVGAYGASSYAGKAYVVFNTSL